MEGVTMPMDGKPQSLLEGKGERPHRLILV
jgi:hypothetical protein